ncbi:MAG: glycerate kinase [Bryobacteraceae bacterium]|nr:glycerate kinase [Bryobacteraceae bacterium]
MGQVTYQKLRRDAQAIFRAALRAADPREGIRRARPRFQALLDRPYDHIYVVGAGKASAAMALEVERILGRRISGGLINTKHGHLATLRRIELNECAHPVPDEAGVAGARRIAQIAAEATAQDLVICLISGGASALLPLPAEGLTLDDKQHVTRQLLACGANIHEINTVRKHLSAIKGGQLAALAAPAKLLTLVLSDVIGDDLSVIGSGPTVPDGSTFAQAREILARYRIQPSAAVARHLAAEARENPTRLPHAQTLIVGANRLAVDAAASEARQRGYRPLVLSTTIEGETRDVARMHAAIAREVLESGQPVRSPACLISGGETTVTLDADGKGGRNQEFVLAAALDLPPGVVVLSAGTDGTDGPTDAAGAIADSQTLTKAKARGLDPRAYLARHDSYHFFDALGDLIRTGPTGTNVMDVRLLLTAARPLVKSSAKAAKEPPALKAERPVKSPKSRR